MKMKSKSSAKSNTCKGSVKAPKNCKVPANDIPDTDNKRLKMSTFCAWEGTTLVLNVLGTPGAKKDAIGKPKGTQLKISVTAPPVAGKATDHMVKFLAHEFDVATGDITVVFGRFNINKQLRIRAPKKLPPVIGRALPQKEQKGTDKNE